MLAKTIHPSWPMRKAFSLYTCIPIHEKLFLYTHALKNSFSLYQHGLYKTSIPFQRFLLPFSTYTHCLYKNFLYIHLLLTHKNFFSHIIYTHKIFSYTFYTQKLFSFLYIQIWHFVHNASFFFYSWCYHYVCSFYFRTMFLNENSTWFQNFNKHYRQ